jgi:hypothetical protein
MKPADLRKGDDPATWRGVDVSGLGTVVVERLVGAHGVVVGDVSAHQPPEVPFMEHEDVVQALTAEGADDPFGERVLPGRSGSDDHVVNSHVGQAPGEALAVDGIPIAEEISWRGLVWEGLEDLAGGPDCRGMIRHGEAEELAAVMAEHDEGEEEAAGEGGNEKEVDGDDVSGMGGEKGTPRGRRVRAPSVDGNAILAPISLRY